MSVPLPFLRFMQFLPEGSVSERMRSTVFEKLRSRPNDETDRSPLSASSKIATKRVMKPNLAGMISFSVVRF